MTWALSKLLHRELKMPLSKIVANSITDNTITTDQIADTSVHGRRNVLINGNYDIWQRATSFTDIAGIWNYGFADRWNAHNDGTNAGTFSQSTTVPNSGSRYSLLLTGASSVTNSNLSQRIESANLGGIRDANSLTLSGYVRSATAGKSIQFYGLAPNATDDFSSYTLLTNLFSTTTMSGNGSGGTIAIGLPDADTWYYFTATATNVNAQTNFDKGLALYISALSQTSSSHQVYFSQLQMEAGNKASPFEHRGVGEELFLCQRYYETSFVGGVSTTNTSNAGLAAADGKAGDTTTSFSGHTPVSYRVSKRSVPTVTFYDLASPRNTGKCHRFQLGAQAHDNSAVTIADSGLTGFNAYSGNGGACSGIAFHYEANAEL